MSVTLTALGRRLAAISEGRAAAQDGRIRVIRTQARLSQSELAAALGVTTATVSRWEAGTRRPRSAAAERLARLLRELDATLTVELTVGRSPETRVPALAGTKGTRENTDDGEPSATGR